MAIALKLVYGDPNAASTTLNLIGGTDGIYLAENGWVPAAADINDPQPVIESITLEIMGSSHDNLASQAVARKLGLRRFGWDVQVG